jgi:hypothetical protein
MTHPRRAITALAGLCLFTFAAVPVVAADESNLPMPLRSGTTVTILRVDGTREQARLVALAPEPPRLLLADSNARRWGGGSWSRELPLSQVEVMEGPGPAKFRPRRLVVGTLVGMLAGGALGFALAEEPHRGRIAWEPWASVPSGPREGRMSDTAMGMAGGAVLGLVVGLFSAPKAGPVRRWTFTESGAAISQ